MKLTSTGMTIQFKIDGQSWLLSLDTTEHLHTDSTGIKLDVNRFDGSDTIVESHTIELEDLIGILADRDNAS